MRKALKMSIPFLMVLALASGCATPAEVVPTPMPAPPPSKSELTAERDRYPTGLTIGTQEEEHKVVKTGHMTLEVESIADTMDKIAHMAEEMGGYVVSSDRREYENGIWGSICIRVPSEKFDRALVRLRQLALAVPYETRQARDVTEEYVDLEARLRNLRATEAQYLALLEKAENVEEMLMVQRELSNVREEIERIEGRIKYLEQTSEMALIEITLQQARPLAEPWSPSQVLKSALRGLVNFARGLAAVLIWMGIFCWAWIPPLAIWLRRRRVQKRTAN